MESKEVLSKFKARNNIMSNAVMIKASHDTGKALPEIKEENESEKKGGFFSNLFSGFTKGSNKKQNDKKSEDSDHFAEVVHKQKNFNSHML
jgi:hypothetical protein